MGRLQIAYIPTDHMPADGLTKVLKAPAYMRFVRLLTIVQEVKKGKDSRCFYLVHMCI